MGTRAGRFSWHGKPGRGDANQMTGGCLGLTVLCLMILAILLIIGGIEQNPCLVVEVENTVQLLHTGYGRNLKSAMLYELCGCWYHHSCGSVQAQAAEREKWNCDKCRTEKVRMLEDDMQNTLRQTDELKAKNREPEEKLLLGGAGKRDTVPAKQKIAKCMVVCDSIVCNVGAEYAHMMVECFPAVTIEQLHRVIEKSNLGSPETVIIHVGTNDLRTTRNLDFVMEKVYVLVATEKRKLLNCRPVLSGVLRHRDVSWQHSGVLNDRLD